MIYKTLIIFDTNRVRHTDYDDFKIGGDYDDVFGFIKKNKLEDLVHVSLPEFVVDEIKKQKIEEFLKDSTEHKRISDKFEKLGIKNISQDVDFDINKHISSNVAKYIKDENLKVIKLPDEKYEEIFRKIIQRAISKQLPFKRNEKHSDMGFKDVLIWETILNNKNLILDYDNIFYCSNDNGFNECKEEFEKNFNKNFGLFCSKELLIEELRKIYSDLIENNSAYSLVKSEYFRDKLRDNIIEQQYIEVGNKEEEISSLNIIDICSDFIKDEGAGIDTSDIFLISSSVILSLKNGQSVNAWAITSIDQNNEFINFELVYE